ncbi:MAG: hypothetical protein H6741_28805 [Alphaproteobacteria bacterium]|nr:hypothetical protein [Alphaproteobacteria bacterium]
MTVQPDLSKLSGEMYRQWETAMAQWWDQVLESPAFLSAMGSNLAAQSQARARYEEAVDDSMAKLHLPSRQDLTRLTRIVTQLEDRLLAMEDRMLEMADQVATMEREALKARVEAAETRIEMRERLAELEAKLAASQPTPAPTPTRSRKKPATES